ncbi:MarR family winged helix-turn-helix transcriptional regulator [Phenylobacterium sp. J367]|uniref:MarR family winged helix-turn-helix transcriptional regulator n=1 Tax=Phenylobacterium sp. J367 TaxID=2898435 RepID=UPI00215138DA|nr:MarR family winged helix-turn-helix transcriptional regulator [Phenylobacterium sp. J367]MCR5877171.1 MarR family winged helix-turn-helix transcriptional regulator [Phenylobacterium sp. J367]
MVPAANPARPAPDLEPVEPVDLGGLADIVQFRFRRLQNHILRDFADRVGPDFRLGAFSTLAVIQANPGLTAAALARAIGYDKTHVLPLLADLEARGWIVRGCSRRNRRYNEQRITADGERGLDQLRAVALQVEARFSAVLTRAERTQLFTLLDRISAVCRPWRERGRSADQPIRPISHCRTTATAARPPSAQPKQTALSAMVLRAAGAS